MSHQSTCRRFSKLWKCGACRRSLLRMRRVLALLLALASCGVAQDATTPQLKLRIVVPKKVYSVDEKLTVTAELNNATSETLCFPAPELSCTTPQTGWLIVTRESPKNESEHFICHADLRGAVGPELDENVRARWVKLAPNGTYATPPIDVAKLFESGDWRISARYHPPEDSFAPEEYRRMLKDAANRNGCVLPDKDAVGSPELISVASPKKE